MSAEALAAVVHGEGTPVLGRQDHIVGFADQLALLDHCPQMTVVVLDGAGHNAHLERPAEVAALFGGWLDAVAAAAVVRPTALLSAP